MAAQRERGIHVPRFSTYDRSVRLSFVDSLFPSLPEINYGLETGHVKLRLDLSARSRLDEVRRCLTARQSLLQLTSTPGQANVLTLDVPITQARRVRPVGAGDAGRWADAEDEQFAAVYGNSGTVDVCVYTGRSIDSYGNLCPSLSRLVAR